MPKGKKNKFIDKKNAVTFRLVHRSQKDPLIADEKAPQHVLVPIEKQSKTHNNESHKLSEKELEKRKEEQKKYGIFFDDDYNYLQHLRDVNKLSTEWEKIENDNEENKKKEKKVINLPSSVFESNVEEKIGLLNKAAPTGLRLDLDPDIVAAMDDDFNYDDPDNLLEDNFIEIANAGSSGEETEYDEEYDSEFDVSSTEERDQVCNLKDTKYDSLKSDTKSFCGSSFSMSSSVIRRNENLKLLDDIHEKVMSEFDDAEIGALNCDEIEGYMESDSKMLLQYAKEFEEKKVNNNANISDLMKDRLKITDLNYNSEEDENDNLIDMITNARERDRWDCESILSVNSSNRNHPGLISEKKNKIDKITIDHRTGIPKNILGNSETKLTAKNLQKLDLDNSSKYGEDSAISVADSRRSQLTMLSYRPDNETMEEKRERKKNLKEYRRERRAEKKANTEAFKQEKKKQEKIIMNNRVNIQGNRIL